MERKIDGNKGGNKSSNVYCDDEIVISGIAGRFPDSDNMRHFQENLFNKVDLVTDDDRRWKLDHPEIPQRTGKINNVGKFDSLFFGVHFKQAHTMDPMCRMLLEHAYEAIVDAGINPRKLRGTKTGVFIGACFSESEKTWFYEKLQVNGFGITGCSRAMLANRISYWLGVNGPSYTVDSACSSSLFAMEHAYRAIRSGQCEAALVGGANLCLHPYVSLQFSRLGVLSPDGRCKSFDADANGYTRSEAVSLVYLQKAKDARRIYATYVHAKTNCDGFKEQGITFPSSVMQSVLLKEFYEECGVPPTSLAYIEAHGTGTKVGDPEEVNALDRVFCTGRDTPLKIGSIKSNLGHAEPASGLCSIAKVVIAMESGLIPPNLHYKRPREGVKALEEGRIKVICDPTSWEGGYVGVNSFGFGGANAHILLKSNAKEKVRNGAPDDDLPRLVVTSGRTEEAADSILKDVEGRPVDVEYVKLLQDIHSEDIPGHMYRGYTIVGGGATREKPLREIQHYPGGRRPVWFVFSGMGSQWPGMGVDLLRFPVFAAAIKKCDDVLKPHGVDIHDILTNPNKSTFDNILNSFVGIAAVQIGLVDLLTDIGVVPDKIIGHSVGELGCAYADGCFTAEQMVLAAYSRGLASIETETIRGSMAAVGLGYEDVKALCPPDIEVACHNGPESSTISGPAESMKAFVDKLRARKIFAREVPCSNIAYHSRYIAAAGPRLLAYLQRVIPEPKPRSQKWLSTSVRRSEWGTAQARLSSAEYHTNNLLSAVLFEETSNLIPKDAVTIEIAPHGLLQAILRRSLNPAVTNIALTQRGHGDNVRVFLQGVGKLFNVGLQPRITKLFPEVEYPVSRGTPMISPLIKWAHTDDWYVTSYRMQEKITSGERTVEVTLSDEDFEYMAGHVIDGRNLLPATGYLALVWETIGMMRGELYTEVSVVFEDVKFLRATTIPKEGIVELTLMIQKGTGRFEVVEGGAAVVTGKIRAVEKPSRETMGLEPPEDDDEITEAMSCRDIYKELKLRGYHYSGLFRGLKSSSIDARKGKIQWSNNWVAFMDNMLQMHILAADTRGLFVPTGIQKLTIDTKTHLNTIREITSEEKELTVRHYENYDAIISGGVEIRGLKASAITRRKPAGEPVLEIYKFVANRDGAETSLAEFVRISANLALENLQTTKFKTIEALEEKTVAAPPSDLISRHFLETLGDLPLVQADVNVAATTNPYDDGKLPQSMSFVDAKKLTNDAAATIVCGRNLFAGNEPETLRQLLLALKDGGFLLTRETSPNDDIYPLINQSGLKIILEKRNDQETLLLLRKRGKLSPRMTVIRVNSDNFDWLPELKAALKSESESTAGGVGRIILVSDKNFVNGIYGLVNSLRKEPGGEIVRGYVIQDEKAPDFSNENPLYSNQLDLDLALNVLRANDSWGTYRHLRLPETSEKSVYHGWANQLVRGDLGSLRWLEGPIDRSTDKLHLARVAFSSINFRDVMLATGKLAIEVVAKNRRLQECPYGLEYSAIDSSGNRIMGLVESRGFSNIVRVDEHLSWRIPKDWTLEDAATVPCVYATCYYALFFNGRIKRGDMVLVHAGSGGVGQAAITLALHRGCRVFTTVGTPEKRRFIEERFPQIPKDHIGCSRDTSFERMIAKFTNGRGVDVVLNSLAEEKLRASVRCLATGGRFLEIGKFDLAANNSLGMEAFLNEISFHGVMLDNLLTAPPEKKAELQKLLQAGLDSGAVKPLTRTVFPKEQLEAAFRYMAAGKHIGKVLLRINPDGDATESTIKAIPRFHCRENRSYVIHGGLGGFGLELADWLVLRGARNIVLTSRKGIKNGYQLKRVELWKSYGVEVRVVAGKDASRLNECEDILREATRLAPVSAIFNLAVVLGDSLIENQTIETFEESFRAKARSAMMLDVASRKLCPRLEHFVVFSSVVCGRGNPGQTNYAMANSAMERICERRANEGLPGLAIQWGAVGDVGLVADMHEEHKELVIGGTLQQKISSCLAVLDKFLEQKSPIVGSMVVAEKRAGGAGALSIVDTVLNIMGLKDLRSVSVHTSLAELGMDSMMAVEIKQTLEREFEIFLNAQDIRSLNFAKLMEMSARDIEEKKRTGKKGTTADEALTGMKLLVQVVGGQELIQDICLELPTKKEVGRDEVFLIPGVEGYGTVFQNLAGKIRSPATCLQFIDDENSSDLPTIADMAQQFLPHVLRRNKSRRDFVIAGYSFGSLVAIELARKLEAEGLTGRLVLIDGSPDLMRAIKNQQLSASTEDELQSNVLLGIMDIMSPIISPELAVALEKCKTWKEKLDAFMSRAPTSDFKITPQEQRNVCTGVFKRLLALEKYDHTEYPRLRSSVILLKPIFPTLKSMSPDYGLGTVSREKIEVFTVEGNHASILDSAKIATAINGEPLEDADAFKARIMEDGKILAPITDPQHGRS